MTVVVNGERKEFSSGRSLAEFIEHLGLKDDRIAVELNRKIAPRNRWTEISLAEGDHLEIVHFVGGGLDYESPQSAHAFPAR
ncbi:MAG: thiamine biosynthesis protein ThiS [Acidobacteria bacterium]|nr:MAG: thiamine biosynthesis protein ThiS [Acidobacteriota bacterium]PYY00839.1 MAG: thiamine biosynthesis protein ThiS [Acidobacteriota bacterium]PYY22195.1 MAG: thiamine biosynthesis protein ThiS [Acidobacteriota bacterium]